MAKMSFRSILGQAVATVTRSWHGLIRNNRSTACQRLKLGLIGAGEYGMTDAEAALQVGGVEIAAICDVDRRKLSRNAARIRKLQRRRPRTYNLFTEMLEREHLDAAIIATPPHWHALQLLACLQHELDVYCEKPLAYDIREGRALVEAVQGHQRIVQVGFQRRQSKAFQEVAAFVKAGKAGPITRVDVQIHYCPGLLDQIPETPSPALDWDRWCGPAPKIPYTPQIAQINWRLEKAIGNGHLVDWGIHYIDATRMILDLGMPKRIEASGGLHHYRGKITTPDELTVRFQFDSLEVTWHHHLWQTPDDGTGTENGVFLHGELATVFISDDRWLVLPKDSPGKAIEHQAHSDMGMLHMKNFLECVRSRQQPDCPIEEGYQSTATVQLGMIAYESGAVIEWDPASEQILNNPAAAELLKREYRQPYAHPYPR